MEESGNCEVCPDFVPLKHKSGIDRSPSACLLSQFVFGRQDKKIGALYIRVCIFAGLKNVL